MSQHRRLRVRAAKPADPRTLLYFNWEAIVGRGGLPPCPDLPAAQPDARSCSDSVTNQDASCALSDAIPVHEQVEVASLIGNVAEKPTRQTRAPYPYRPRHSRWQRHGRDPRRSPCEADAGSDRHGKPGASAQSQGRRDRSGSHQAGRVAPATPVSLVQRVLQLALAHS